MLFKEIVDARTDARTDGRTTNDGRRTLKDHKSSLSTSCSGELKRKNCEKRSGGSSVNDICFNKIMFLKLLPSCKDVNPLQMSYLNIPKRNRNKDTSTRDNTVKSLIFVARLIS